MKWFKHISDSLDDPFIFDLMTQYGSDGYLVFFGVLEIYAREFKPELDWKLRITREYLKQKLHKRQDTLVIKSLKHIKNSGKWEIDINDREVIVFIPKFKEILDDWTLRKLRSDSVVAPKKHRLDKEAEEEAEEEGTKVPICPHKKIIEIYHSKCSSLPIVQSFNDGLQKQLKTRWREDPQRQNLKWWEWYFENINQSDYLMGKVNSWSANFGWLTGPKNMTKVLNGQYLNRGSKTDQAIGEFLNE
ncbi:MAG TPA: hypothetical protein ENI07_13535 [Desulfobacterales bacterium]|nr:hypothetical protein [Desulfobacterales bacterium]